MSYSYTYIIDPRHNFPNRTESKIKVGRKSTDVGPLHWLVKRRGFARENNNNTKTTYKNGQRISTERKERKCRKEHFVK